MNICPKLRTSMTSAFLPLRFPAAHGCGAGCGFVQQILPSMRNARQWLRGAGSLAHICAASVPKTYQPTELMTSARGECACQSTAVDLEALLNCAQPARTVSPRSSGMRSD